MYKTPDYDYEQLSFTSFNATCGMQLDPENEWGHISKKLPYKVFDADGKVVYEPKTAEPAVKVPFLVKVSISDLNIRTGPGVNHSRVQFCPPGVYTIVAVSEGAGASMWGKLKSGIGWLSLDFCRRL